MAGMPRSSFEMPKSLIFTTGLSTECWISTFPGLAILTLVMGINLMGEGLRDTLDPRLKE